jgi:hypothetical protein
VREVHRHGVWAFFARTIQERTIGGKSGPLLIIF